MRRILKTNLRIDLYNFFAAFFHLGVSHFEPFANQPLFRCQIADFLEVPLNVARLRPV